MAKKKAASKPAVSVGDSANGEDAAFILPEMNEAEIWELDCRDFWCDCYAAGIAARVQNPKMKADEAVLVFRNLWGPGEN